MPNRLGRYVVQRRIGSGGFATVWLAYDEQLDSPVAVKVLAENWTGDAHIRRRFGEEGRYLRRVESPHVVTVYDAGELDDERPYLVMTYADQGTLADRLEATSGLEGGGLTIAQSMEVVRQVACGLQALHDRDIVHRDIKPANVLFRTVGSDRTEVRAMVGDLGLGKALDGSSRLTMIAGTPSFAAPEQAAAEAVDGRADQYSLAALAYLLLCGHAPFAYADLKSAADPTPMPPLSSKDLGPEVEEVLRRGLAPDREERFASVTAFSEALSESLIATVGDQARPVEPGTAWLPVDPDLTQIGARPTAAARPVSVQPPARRRRPWLLGLGVLALAAVVAGTGGWAAYQYRDGHEDPAAASTELTDDSGLLSATVPVEWDQAVATAAWQPPKQKRTYPSLSVGTSASWASGAGEGVFVGLLGSDKLPSKLPQHKTCGTRGTVSMAPAGTTPSKTQVFSDCPGGATVIERVVQLTDAELMWVQIRSLDSATAYDVLGSVVAHGF